MSTSNFRVDEKLSATEVQIHNLIQHLLIVLSEKEKYIIQNRFALETKGKRQTLEEIGKHFGVTRERIRQIEKSALRKLERNAQNTNIKILTEFAKSVLEKEGGIAQDKHFKSILLSILPNITDDEIYDLHLALVLDANIHFQSNTLKFHPFWRTSKVEASEFRAVAQQGIKILKKSKNVIPLSKLSEKINTNLKLKLSDKKVNNILMISKDVKFTDTGIGLLEWRHINPRTLRDKINFVLKHEKKPLHFQKIAELIDKSSFDEKNVNTQAVHNELIRNEQFILIGRGIYALKEWGFKTGTVADVIESILSDGEAMTREEITKAVLEQRQVKTITIYLNLKNKPQFTRVGRNRYMLTSMVD